MRNFFAVFMLVVLSFSCSYVPAGHVGIKVNLLGGDKGVDATELPVGRYWIGMNEELYIYPIFQQNYVWAKDAQEGSPNDESITFQSREGLEVNADFGITYSVDPSKVSILFQKYRKGVEEITDGNLRMLVRDALNANASRLDVEELYGEKRNDFIASVQEDVAQVVKPIGINVEKITLIGSFRLPPQVQDAINQKIGATQKAQQRENELREEEANAKKKVAAAQGEAESILLKAKAQANANRILSESLSERIIQYEMVQKWNGITPTVQGQAGMLLNINQTK